MAVQKERKINYADRHWTEKPLDQMRERDWRIFKEDFNISCKGITIVLHSVHVVVMTFIFFTDTLTDCNSHL
jgi:hypothetical protein